MKKRDTIAWLESELLDRDAELQEVDSDLEEAYERLNSISELASPDHAEVARAKTAVASEQERSRQFKQQRDKLQTHVDNQKAELARLNAIISSGEDRYYQKWKSQLSSRVDADERAGRYRRELEELELAVWAHIFGHSDGEIRLGHLYLHKVAARYEKETSAEVKAAFDAGVKGWTQPPITTIGT
jgi:uncharacterized protein YPO0396